MKNIETEIICCPHCKGNLDFSGPKDPALTGSYCQCTRCGSYFAEKNGFIDFLNSNFEIFKSRREEILRSWYARIYTPATDFMFAFCGGPKNARKEVLSELEVKNGDLILETGTGPGDNFPYLNAMNSGITIYGIDIQDIMLIQCLKNARKWDISARLYRAGAEELPFRDEVFDVVFHLGAFNLFSDKNKAVREMIRVAKPGSKVVIADESEKGNRIFNKITGNKAVFSPPLHFIPDNMLDIKEKTIWKGYGYVITFVKP